MPKIMPDKVAQGLDAILMLVPGVERTLDVIEPKILKYGDRNELRALTSLTKDLAEIVRLAENARRGEFRGRGEGR